MGPLANGVAALVAAMIGERTFAITNLIFFVVQFLPIKQSDFRREL
jgi:hypothetical protein